MSSESSGSASSALSDKGKAACVSAGGKVNSSGLCVCPEGYKSAWDALTTNKFCSEFVGASMGPKGTLGEPSRSVSTVPQLHLGWFGILQFLSMVALFVGLRIWVTRRARIREADFKHKEASFRSSSSVRTGSRQRYDPYRGGR